MTLTGCLKNLFCWCWWLTMPVWLAARTPTPEQTMPVDSSTDSVRTLMDRGPAFSLFKDNYFILGTDPASEPDEGNTDAAFQISFSWRMTKSSLPGKTHFFVQYTQKAYWSVLERSLPMRDLNFNPGVGLGHFIIHRNRYIGRAYLMLEHESNGEKELLSRSWNRLSAGVALDISRNWSLQCKAWVPFIDSRRNKDILLYNGICLLAADWHTANRIFSLATTVTVRQNARGLNTQWEAAYRLGGSRQPSLFLQYYNGYGENLLDYNRYVSRLRMGIVIRPQDVGLR